MVERQICDMRERNISDAEFRRIYGVIDNRDWKLATARSEISALQDWKLNIIQCAYRPFDDRWCHFGNVTMDYPRRELLNNVAGKENIVLTTPRQISSPIWRHVMATEKSPNDCLISNATKEANYAFPLYIYQQCQRLPAPTKSLTFLDAATPHVKNVRRENISSDFRSLLTAGYQTAHITPEQIFGYIYAVLHAPTYRHRYAEFLRGDFPRIPLCACRDNFESLAKLGWDLAQTHLLKQIPPNPVKFLGKKTENLVEKPSYSPAEQAIYINATNHFAPVPEAVWNFYIGGYQVIEKYLKSRKGRILTLDEVTTIENIVAVLTFTITQMQAIDTAYRTAFPTHQ